MLTNHLRTYTVIYIVTLMAYFTKTNPSDNILNKWTKAMVMVFKDGPLFTYAFEVSLKLNPNLNKTQYFS